MVSYSLGFQIPSFTICYSYDFRLVTEPFLRFGFLIIKNIIMSICQRVMKRACGKVGTHKVLGIYYQWARLYQNGWLSQIKSV